MSKFEELLQTIEMWANDDIDKDAVMGADEFYATIVDNDATNPAVILWNFYQYLTGAGDEW